MSGIDLLALIILAPLAVAAITDLFVLRPWRRQPGVSDAAARIMRR